MIVPPSENLEPVSGLDPAILDEVIRAGEETDSGDEVIQVQPDQTDKVARARQQRWRLVKIVGGSLAATILGSGNSSRLYKALKERENLVTTVDAQFEVRKDPGMFLVSCELPPQNEAKAGGDLFEVIYADPELLRGFVKGMVKGLKFLYANPSEAAEIAKKQFPTMALEDLKATLDRSFKDQMWSKDGLISKEAWATGSAVVREAGILKTDVKYEEIIDMSFVESVRASL